MRQVRTLTPFAQRKINEQEARLLISELLAQLKITYTELEEMWKEHCSEHNMDFPVHVKEMFAKLDSVIARAEVQL